MNKFEKPIPDPSPIKPEYVNFSWNEFVPMDSVLPPQFVGILMMNKNLDILNTRNGKITKVDNYKKDCYGYQYYNSTIGDVSISFKIHRKGADLFLVNDNPAEKIFIDHCNRDPSDCRLTNFRHATPKENAENSTPRKENDRNFLRKTTLDGSFVEDIPYTHLSYAQRSNIFTCMRKWGEI